MIPCTPRWRLTEAVVIKRVLKQTQSLLSISRVLRLISAAEDTTDTINKDINKMDLGWSVEEAEVAAKDRSVSKFLVNQAAGASMHEADR